MADQLCQTTPITTLPSLHPTINSHSIRPNFLHRNQASSPAKFHHPTAQNKPTSSTLFHLHCRNYKIHTNHLLQTFARTKSATPNTPTTCNQTLSILKNSENPSVVIETFRYSARHSHRAEIILLDLASFFVISYRRLWRIVVGGIEFFFENNTHLVQSLLPWCRRDRSGSPSGLKPPNLMRRMSLAIRTDPSLACRTAGVMELLIVSSPGRVIVAVFSDCLAPAVIPQVSYSFLKMVHFPYYAAGWITLYSISFLGDRTAREFMLEDLARNGAIGDFGVERFENHIL